MADIIQIGKVYLAKAGDRISDYRINGEPATQPALLAFAASAEMINRGNRATTLTFTRTTPPHASPAAARAAIDAHEAELAALDLSQDVADRTVRLRYEAPTAIVRIIPNAVVLHSGSHSGTSTTHTYTITGGAITTPQT